MSTAGLILAAGEGARFGGPKALAVRGDRTWLQIAIKTLLEGGCAPILAVLGASAEDARARVGIDRLADMRSDRIRLRGNDAEIIWVVNDAWRQGRTGSLQCGLRALPEAVTGAVIHAVDHPDVRPGTIAALLAAASRSGSLQADVSPSSILVPVYRGRRGHPIWMHRSVWPEVLALAPDDPLHEVIHRDPRRAGEVEVDDPGIHRNRNEAEPQDESSGSAPSRT